MYTKVICFFSNENSAGYRQLVVSSGLPFEIGNSTTFDSLPGKMKVLECLESLKKFKRRMQPIHLDSRSKIDNFSLKSLGQALF